MSTSAVNCRINYLQNVEDFSGMCTFYNVITETTSDQLGCF